MALNVGTLLAVLRLNADGFNKGLETASKKLQDTSDKMSDVSMKVGLVTAAMAGAAAMAIHAASDFDETTNLIQTGFGEASQSVEKWAATTAQEMGRSTQQIRDFAGSMQVMLAPMLGSADAAHEMSQGIAKLAVDLGSFFNVADKDALIALKSGMTGESEPMKKFGVVMLENSLNAYALAKGLGKTTQQMTEAEKVALRYNFIMEKTALAQGDAVKTAGSFGNQLKRAQGNAENFAVAIGMPLKDALLPLLTYLNKIGNALSGLSPYWLEMGAKATIAAIAIGGLITALTGAGAAIAAVTAFLPAILTGLASLFTTVLPIVVIVGVLVIALGALYKAWKVFGDEIKKVATDSFGALERGFSSLLDGAVNVYNAFVGMMADLVTLPGRAILTMIDGHLKMFQTLLQKLKPMADALGFGDKVGSALNSIGGARAGIANDQAQFGAFGENLKKAFDPSEIWKNTSSYWGAGGEGRGMLVEAGKQVGDVIMFGAEGAADLLGDLLGVTGKAQAAAKAGTNTDFGGISGVMKKKYDGHAPFGVDDFVAKKAKIADTFREALDMALADKAMWQSSAFNFAYGVSDALVGALKGVRSELAGPITSVIEDAAGQIYDASQTEGGKAALGAGADMLDSLLKGSLAMPDLGALGSALGNSIAPGIGGMVGNAVGGALTEVGSAIVDQIKALVSQFFQGVQQMATILSDIVLSKLGAKAQGTMEGFGQGAAFVGAAASSAGALAGLALMAAGLAAALTVLLLPVVSAAVTIGLLLSPILILIGSLVALNLAIVVLVLSPLIILGAALLVVVGAVAAFAGVVALTVGWFVALLQIATMTKSFERFSLAIEWGARSIVTAVEPLFAALMPLAAVAVVMMQTFASLSGVFLTMLENMGFFNFLFEALRLSSIMVLQFALALIAGVEIVIKVFKNLANMLGFGDLGDSLQEVDDAIDDWQTSLGDSIGELTGMTLASATAAAINAAAMEELAAAADKATAGSLNLPEAFKLAAARNNAIIGGLGDADGPFAPADSKRPIVNVWINGEHVEEIATMLEDRERFTAFVNTGIPIRSPRRKNNSPKSGN